MHVDRNISLFFSVSIQNVALFVANENIFLSLSKSRSENKSNKIRETEGKKFKRNQFT